MGKDLPPLIVSTSGAFVAISRQMGSGYEFNALTPQAIATLTSVTDATKGGPPFVNGAKGKELDAVDEIEAKAVLATLERDYTQRLKRRVVDAVRNT